MSGGSVLLRLFLELLGVKEGSEFGVAASSFMLLREEDAEMALREVLEEGLADIGRPLEVLPASDETVVRGRAVSEVAAELILESPG
jgi:hypothetical protein